jgi:hypothetical protein
MNTTIPETNVNNPPSLYPERPPLEDFPTGVPPAIDTTGLIVEEIPVVRGIVQVKPKRDCSVVLAPIPSVTIAGQLQSYLMI